jgi:hypothetical protein
MYKVSQIISKVSRTIFNSIIIIPLYNTHLIFAGEMPMSLKGEYIMKILS